MLADAEAQVVLTQSELLETLPATTAPVLCLDQEEEALLLRRWSMRQ
jgi:hypothetical protein